MIKDCSRNQDEGCDEARSVYLGMDTHDTSPPSWGIRLTPIRNSDEPKSPVASGPEGRGRESTGRGLGQPGPQVTYRSLWFFSLARPRTEGRC